MYWYTNYSDVYHDGIHIFRIRTVTEGKDLILRINIYKNGKINERRKITLRCKKPFGYIKGLLLGLRVMCYLEKEHWEYFNDTLKELINTHFEYLQTVEES